MRMDSLCYIYRIHYNESYSRSSNTDQIENSMLIASQPNFAAILGTGQNLLTNLSSETLTILRTQLLLCGDNWIHVYNNSGPSISRHTYNQYTN